MAKRIALRSILTACVLWAIPTAAQTLTASNVSVYAGGPTISISENGSWEDLDEIVGLTDTAATGLPSGGLSGYAMVFTSSNQLSIQTDSIAYISCDASAYPGYVTAIEVFETAVQKNAAAIVLYSTQAVFCDLSGWDGSYNFIFTTLRENPNIPQIFTGEAIKAKLTKSSDMGNGTLAIAPQEQHVKKPNSTAIAMVILYSITGLVTVLFMVIIVIGALRAHRNPERYGARNIVGRPRQSRAQGLARAMLETIPIVKFGEQGNPKVTDVELSSTVEAHDPTSNEAHSQVSAPPHAIDESPASTEQPVATNEGGIEAATKDTTATETPAAKENEQTCSICTDDFELGQDQRILPCGHSFHPICVDPWLLNISGTCPLCRVDLNASNAEASESAVDENGNPIASNTESNDQLPPPLGRSNEARTSVGRSILAGIAGASFRTDRPSADQYFAVVSRLRQEEAARRRAGVVYRQQLAAARPHDGAASLEEAGMNRRNLANVFGIRTRRTGPAGQPVATAETEAPTDAPVVDTPVAHDEATLALH